MDEKYKRPAQISTTKPKPAWGSTAQTFPRLRGLLLSVSLHTSHDASIVSLLSVSIWLSYLLFLTTASWKLLFRSQNASAHVCNARSGSCSSRHPRVLSGPNPDFRSINQLILFFSLTKDIFRAGASSVDGLSHEQVGALSIEPLAGKVEIAIRYFADEVLVCFILDPSFSCYLAPQARGFFSFVWAFLLWRCSFSCGRMRRD